MIVNVAFEVSQDAFDRAAKVVEHFSLHEPGFSGATIERGEHTCVHSDDNYNACVLYNAVLHAIDNDEDSSL